MGELVDRDQEHLRLLKFGFYLMAGTTGFFSLFALLYIVMGGLFAFGVFPTPEGFATDQRFMGRIFLVLGLAFFLIGLILTLLTYFAGRSIRERRRRMLCMAVAGLWCLWVPFGTAIGVCAILVLNRPSVEALFTAQGTPPPIPSPPSSVG